MNWTGSLSTSRSVGTRTRWNRVLKTATSSSVHGPARDRLTAKTSVRHTGRTTGIAEAAVFLASEAACTGVVLDVDGGISIGSSIR